MVAVSVFRLKIYAVFAVPLIGWSIQAAQKSECFDRIIVSTDNDEIANIALSLGAEVPFLRPSHLSDDHTSTKTLLFTQLIGYLSITVFLNSLLLIATAPFVTKLSQKIS